MGHNVVVLIADTLRGPASFPAGEMERRMPFLTALAGAGRSLPNFVASSSWTFPSHLALLNGLEPWSVPGRRASRPGGGPDPPSLAESCREVSGRSAAFSHNPLVATETGVLRGYDAVLPASLTFRSGFTVGLNCLWDPLESWLARHGSGTGTERRPVRGVRRLSRAVATSLARAARSSYGSAGMVRSLREYLAGRDPRAPQHLFVNLMEAHEPYLPPHLGPEWAAPEGPPATSNLAFYSASGAVAPGASPDLTARYLTSLSALDARLSEVFSTLRRSGVLDDATVAVVSDHGQSLGEHGFVGHGWHLYDELVRVPCTIWSSRGLGPIAAARENHLDHRHLYEVLRSTIVRGTPPENGQWETALRVRGPAYSFVRSRAFEHHNPLRRSKPVEMWRRYSPVALRRMRPEDPRIPEHWAESPHGSATEEAIEGAHAPPVWWEGDVSPGFDDPAPALPLESWGYGE